jgi:hypothetical protein
MKIRKTVEQVIDAFEDKDGIDVAGVLEPVYKDLAYRKEQQVGGEEGTMENKQSLVGKQLLRVVDVPVESY